MFGRVFFFNLFVTQMCYKFSHFFLQTNPVGVNTIKQYTHIYIALFATKDVFLGSIETSPPGGREE